MTELPDYRLSHLEALESEAIHIFQRGRSRARASEPHVLWRQGLDRDVAACAEVILASPHSLSRSLHVDTGPELSRGDRLPRPPRCRAGGPADRRLCSGRDLARSCPAGAERLAQPNPDTCAPGGSARSIGFTALFGGARRDEEKARAKERIFSFRDEFGQWDPKNQRPELWNLYNGRIHLGRVDPRVSFVELDRAGRVALHRAAKRLEIPDLYYAREREVFEREAMLYAANELCLAA